MLRAAPAQRLVATLAAALAAAGCGGSSSYQLERDIDRTALDRDQAARHDRLVTDAEAAWAQRGDPPHLAAAIARWEDAIRIQDDDWRSYAHLAAAYFFQADAQAGFAAMGGDYPYDADDVVDQAAARRYLALLRRGYTLALRGMAARSRELEVRLRAGVRLESAIQVIGKDAAPLLYWYVASLAHASRAQGTGALMANRGRLLATIYRLRAVDPAYQYGGADRLLGIYYAAAPGLLGGDLGASEAHFRAALRAAPGYLENPVWAALTLHRKKKDRAAFQAALRGVLAAPDGPPEIAPDNRLARRKAERLLRRLDRWFPRSGTASSAQSPR